MEFQIIIILWVIILVRFVDDLIPDKQIYGDIYVSSVEKRPDFNVLIVNINVNISIVCFGI